MHPRSRGLLLMVVFAALTIASLCAGWAWDETGLA